MKNSQSKTRKITWFRKASKHWASAIKLLEQCPLKVHFYLSCWLWPSIFTKTCTWCPISMSNSKEVFDHSFFIKTSTFSLRLAVLIFFFFFFFIFEAEMYLICSYFPDWTLQCHKEECQTEYNKNTLFHFFHYFLSSRGCSTEKPFCNCAKTDQKIRSKNSCKRVQFFIKVARFKSATLLKLNSFTGIFHRSWAQMQLYTL